MEALLKTVAALSRVYAGIDPHNAVMLNAVTDQLRVAWMLVLCKHYVNVYNKAVATTPGEQYRRHIRAGGYRP